MSDDLVKECIAARDEPRPHRPPSETKRLSLTEAYAVRDRLHHVCIIVDSIADARRVCADAGAEIIVEGKVGEDGEVIYVDFGGGPGHIVEILQPMTGSAGLFQMIRDAGKDWDGATPLRVLE